MPNIRLQALCAVLWLASSNAIAQGSGGDQPPYMAELLKFREDDPLEGVGNVRSRLLDPAVATDDSARFWLHLALSELLSALDDARGASEALKDAERLLPAAGSRAPLWFELRSIGVATATQPVAEQRRRIEALKAAARDDAALSCRMNFQRAFILHAAEANAEAWSVTEDAAQCAERFREPRYEMWSLYWRATLATRMTTGTPAETFVERALQRASGLPVRRRHAELRIVAAEVATVNKQPKQALAHLQDALAGMRALHDEAATARVLTELARHHLANAAPAAALEPAREAAALLRPPRPLYRWAIAESMLVDAMAQTRHAGLGAEVDRLRGLDLGTLTLREKARVSRSLSRGYTALGRHAAAATELERFISLRESIEARQRDTEVRALAARHETELRAAENRELRLRQEASRLDLAVQRERQRALAAGLVTALVSLAVAAVWGVRVWRSRRQLADLAALDELTGMPNRRAASTYARQQLALAHRLRLPFSLALIDLDHFKKVNDTHGHAVGDAVLRSLALALQAERRGPDLLGRWGGEEWLLVMPGTALQEIPGVYQRLRAAFSRAEIPGLPSPHGLTFSMGASEAISGHPESFESLLERADRCLYAAKQQGRDRLSTSSAHG